MGPGRMGEIIITRELLSHPRKKAIQPAYEATPQPLNLDDIPEEGISDTGEDVSGDDF